MPHETIFVEYRDGDGDPCRVATFPSREPGDHEGHLIGYLIHEFKEGEQWGIVAVSTFRSADGQTRLDAFEYGLDADGAVIYDEGDRMLTTAPAELDGLAGFAYTLAPVMSVHVIDAIGSKLIDGELPRARRREYERRHRATHPHVYIVRIGGERMPSLTTGTGARLTVRFLVRGHWRTLPGKRVWVRPHVKGPAGAPWKGKPVYVRADVPAGNPTTSA